MPYSHAQYITQEDVLSVPADMRPYARQEIYARQGKPFDDPKYREYFESRSWYQINPDYDFENEERMIGFIGMDNVALIQKYEQ